MGVRVHLDIEQGVGMNKLNILPYASPDPRKRRLLSLPVIIGLGIAGAATALAGLYYAKQPEMSTCTFPAFPVIAGHVIVCEFPTTLPVESPQHPASTMPSDER